MGVQHDELVNGSSVDRSCLARDAEGPNFPPPMLVVFPDSYRCNFKAHTSDRMVAPKNDRKW